ncbi:MAG TPA: methyltransferase domain-containing protein [Caulobacteraceae bacterium]|nr:methyltransferase domain-containing protein [Caulobacteraceae bacterium]
MTSAAALAGYAADAEVLIPRYRTIDSEALYAPVLDLLSEAPGAALDVGAGTGRDADWLARRGWRVTAVEPVAAFRGVCGGTAVEWIDGRLPDLAPALAGRRFELVIVNAVWQHLDDAERARSVGPLVRTLASGGLLVLSIRHGPGAPSRPVHPASAEDAVALFEAEGLTCVRRVETDSIQPENRAAGVRWTWLGFRRGA